MKVILYLFIIFITILLFNSCNGDAIDKINIIKKPAVILSEQQTSNGNWAVILLKDPCGNFKRIYGGNELDQFMSVYKVGDTLKNGQRDIGNEKKK